MGLLLETAGRPPDETALDDLQGRRRTWAELDRRATRMARLLRDELGLAANDHAALLMHNRAEAVELVLGAMLAGVWLTPINHHLTAEEVGYVVADSGARVLFMDPEHGSLVRAAVAAGCTPPADAEGGRGTADAVSTAEIAERPAPASAGARSRTPVLVTVGDELEHALAGVSEVAMATDGVPGATMIYTSGTTGRPKGVKRARAATVAEAFAAAKSAGATLGLNGEGPHLVTGPLYHAAPLLFAVYDLLAGAPMIVMPRWDPQHGLDLIQQQRVRHTHLVPTMFVRLLQLPEDVRGRFDASSLRVVLHGAAPIARHVKHAMIEWWGEVLVEYWGATESGVCTLAGSREWLERPGTVGRPTASFEVVAVDDEGRLLPPGEIGTLRIRHKRLAVPFEYHRAPDKTAQAYDRCAFTIGDIGWVDADGYVYLTDRKSHTIISGGVNIFPAEVEDVLHGHPAVADVAVFGVPDDEWGESVKAAVELHPGHAPSCALEREILAFARERLAAYKVPRSIDFEERLPRHPTGKLLVRRLRDRYWQKTGRSI